MAPIWDLHFQPNPRIWDILFLDWWAEMKLKISLPFLIFHARPPTTIFFQRGTFPLTKDNNHYFSGIHAQHHIATSGD